jgi:RNA polymerase sigma factor (sigma-70 family)
MDISDGELLAAFVRKKDESSFEELVRRHGTMVYNVCRRLLRQTDAEDAAQAVFVALSLRAGDRSLHARASLSGWLYEAAVHVGLRTRDAACVRARREQEAGAMRDSVVNATVQWERLEPVLDGELSALPEKYRAAIVLHHLEQHSVEETAGLIRCSVDAVKQRLSRGREMLRERLTRSGVALNVALIAALLDKEAASPAPPLWLTAAANKAAEIGLCSSETLSLARSTADAMLRRDRSRFARTAMVAAILVLAFSGMMMAALSTMQVPAPPAPMANFKSIDSTPAVIDHSESKSEFVEARTDRKIYRWSPAEQPAPVSVISMVPQKDDPRPQKPAMSGPVSGDDTDAISAPPAKLTTGENRDAPKITEDTNTSTATSAAQSTGGRRSQEEPMPQRAQDR